MKLLDLLVQELPERGGWPEGALNATQDKDGEVGFSAGAVPEFGYAAWEGGDWCGSEFYTTRASDYDTAIVTREQYESALAASKAVAGHDGWIQWAGGECPVDSDAIVEVKCRWHNQHQHQYQYNNDRAGDFYWAHTGSNADIIAYRLQNPTKSEQACDDAAEADGEADLNECIGQGVVLEWDGVGLPPVGCECEVKRAIDWVKCKILFISDAHVVLMADEECCWNTCACQFRPLRPEAERAREAAAKEMARHANSDPHRKFNAGLRNCLSIYDAIAAGKIPGVKLDVK